MNRYFVFLILTAQYNLAAMEASNNKQGNAQDGNKNRAIQAKQYHIVLERQQVFLPAVVDYLLAECEEQPRTKEKQLIRDGLMREIENAKKKPLATRNDK